jgi:CRP-like cAMP-binding protein
MTAIRPVLPKHRGRPVTPQLRASLFESVSQGHHRLGRAFIATDRVKIGAEARIVWQACPLNHVYWLRAGWAFRYRALSAGRRQVLSVYLPGDIIGLDCLMSPQPSYAVDTLTRCTYYALDHIALRAALVDPDTALYVAWAIRQEAERSDAHVAWLGRYSAEERIAAFLLSLYERLAQLEMTNGRGFVCPMSQGQIADCLGITLVHVNRVLKRLSVGGVVTFQNHIAIVHDLEHLRSLAQLADGAEEHLSEAVLDGPLSA